MTDYLIAVFSDRLAAEAAYTALEKAEIAKEQIAILGRGYRTVEVFGMVTPAEKAKKRSRSMAYWLVPFGFVAGYAFNLQTGIEIVNWAGSTGNHLIGGLFGAIAGVMGSVFVGGGISLSENSDNSAFYRNSLEAGKYLVAVQGSALLKRQATEMLRTYNPETIQTYSDL